MQGDGTLSKLGQDRWFMQGAPSSTKWLLPNSNREYVSRIQPISVTARLRLTEHAIQLLGTSVYMSSSCRSFLPVRESAKRMIIRRGVLVVVPATCESFPVGAVNRRDVFPVPGGKTGLSRETNIEHFHSEPGISRHFVALLQILLITFHEPLLSALLSDDSEGFEDPWDSPNS